MNLRDYTINELIGLTLNDYRAVNNYIEYKELEVVHVQPSTLNDEFILYDYKTNKYIAIISIFINPWSSGQAFYYITNESLMHDELYKVDKMEEQEEEYYFNFWNLVNN